MAGFEFRVVWQREGGGRQTQIFQRPVSATEKRDRLMLYDELKHTEEYQALADMPDLTGEPSIERAVGEWEPVTVQASGSRCPLCQGSRLQLGGWMGPTKEAPMPRGCPRCAEGLAGRPLQEAWARYLHRMAPCATRDRYLAALG